MNQSRQLAIGDRPRCSPAVRGLYSRQAFFPLFLAPLWTARRVTVSDTRANDMSPRQPTQRTRERQWPAPGQAQNARARGTVRARAIAGNSFVTLGH